MRIAVLRRYRELVRLVRREGFGPFVSAAGREERTVANPGVRLRLVLEEAGGVYVKLGQIAATRVDLLPPEISDELAEAPEPGAARADTEAIRPVLEAELGDTVERVFAEFDWEPLAAASIGQTYRARLRSGEAVVVKVQRPGISGRHRARPRRARAPRRRRAAPHRVRSGHALGRGARRSSRTSLRAELDFRREADAMAEMALLLGPTSAVRVPKVHRELCTRRLLVQERFEGFTVADTDRLERVGHRPHRARRAAAARDARSGAAARLLPRRSAPGQHLRLRRRHARAHRLRCGRPARSDPAGGGRRHPGRADAAAT